MKKHKNIFILIGLVATIFTACLNNRPIVFKEYSDYPPLVLQNNLQQTYDSCKWFLYREYANSKCVSCMNESSGLVSDHTCPPNYLTTYSIMLDTLLIKGDTVIFYTYFATNKNSYCLFFKYDDSKGLKDLRTVTALSLSKDTIIYIEYATGKGLLNKEYPHSKVYSAFDNIYYKNRMNNRLKKRILNDSINIHPWLRRQAIMRGWLSDVEQK